MRSTLVVCLALGPWWYGCSCEPTSPVSDGGVDVDAGMNRPPVLDVPPELSVLSGAVRVVTVGTMDPDGDPVTVSLTQGPTWATLTGNEVRLAPPKTALGSHALTLRAGDGAATVDVAVQVTVTASTPANRAPVSSALVQIDQAGASIPAGATTKGPLSAKVRLDDPENDLVRLEVEVVSVDKPFANVATASGAAGPEGVVTLPLGSFAVGTYAWQARGVDALGAAGPWVSFSKPAFTAGPGAITGALIIAAGAPATKTTAVTLAMAATATAGRTVVEMRFSNDGVTYGPFQPFSTTASYSLVSGDGLKTVYAELRDSTGETAIFSDVIVLDTVAPNVAGFAVAQDAPAVNALMTALTYSVSDLGSGIAAEEASNDGTSFSSVSASSPTWTLASGADGVRTVTLRVTDAAGNTATATDTVELDTNAPAVTSLQLNGGATATSTAVATLSVGASDGAGTGLREICVDGDATADCTPFGNGSIAVELTVGDGLKTIGVLVRDQAGNASPRQTVTITLDTQAPSGTVTLNAGASFTNATTVTLTVSTVDLSTVSICASENPAAPTVASTCWAPLAGSMAAFTLSSGDGLKTVSAWFKDAAGNVSTTAATDTITLDQTPPVLDVSAAGLGLAGGATYINTVTTPFNHTASDSTSGLAQVCTGSTSPPSSCGAYTAAPSVGLGPSPGAQTRYIRVVDAAGNASAIASDTITLDTTPPTLLAIGVSSAATGSSAFTPTVDLSITASANDDLGVASIAFSADGVNFGAPVAYAPSVAHQVSSAQGPKTVYARVIDVAGNVSSWPYAQGSILLDSVAPGGTVSIAAGASYSTSGVVSVALTTSEAGSGVTHMCVRVTAGGVAATAPSGPSDACFVNFASPTNVTISGGGDGPRRVSVWLRDGASNVGAAGFDEIVLDTTPPAAPTGVTATSSHRTVTVSFTGSTSADTVGYRVGTSRTSSGPYTFSSTVAGSPVTLQLANTLTWFLVIEAVDGAGLVGSPSTEVSASPKFPFDHVLARPTSNDLTSIAYVSGASRYVVVGASGAVYTATAPLATNSTFARRDAMVDTKLTAVDASGSLVAVVGEGGAIAVSVDGAQLFTQGTNTLTADLNDVVYAGAVGLAPFDSKYFVAVGNNGTVVRGSVSATPGLTFSPVTTNTSKALRAVTRCTQGASICAGDTDLLIAVGDDGAILKSVDKGASWTLDTPPVAYAAADFRDIVQQPGTDTLYIVGDNMPAGWSSVLVSTNGGTSWTANFSPSTTDFVGKSAAAVGGDLWVLGTASGLPVLSRFSGNTRTDQPAVASYDYTAVVARTSSELTVVGNRGALQSTTNGTAASPSWSVIGTGLATLNQWAVVVPTTLAAPLWTVGQSGFIARNSLSIGATFVQQGAGVTSYTLRGLALVDTNGSTGGVAGFAVSDQGEILGTTNGGVAWAVTATAIQSLYAVSCLSTSACTAVGGNQLVTQYNGTSWVNAFSTTIGAYLGVDHYAASSGGTRVVIVGAQGAFRRYDGSAWSTATLSPGITFSGVCAKRDGLGQSSSGVVLAAGGNASGLVMKSTDHGANWTPVAFSGPPLADVVNVPGTSVWYAVGATGFAAKSTDDGTNWTPLVTHTTRDLRKVAVTGAAGASQRVWIAGDASTVLMSTTGGF